MSLDVSQGVDMAKVHIQELLRHIRDVHLMWVKPYTETLGNKGLGF